MIIILFSCQDKIDENQIIIYSPDGVPEQLKDVIVSEQRAEFIVPELNIYNMIVNN